MKAKILTSLIALVAFASIGYAEDRRGGPRRPPHRPPHHRPPHHNPPRHNPPHYHRGCSPELVQTNMNTVEKVLNETAARSDFASAVMFQDTIVDIQKNQDVNQRMEAYMGIVGIDSLDKVADLLGGENTGAYIETAKINLELNDEQSEVVVDSLSKALRGNLE